jgi:hypothetical protein
LLAAAACISVTNVHTRLTSCSTQYSRLDPNLLPVVALPPHQPAPATRMRPVTTAPRLQHAHEAAASLRLPDHHKQEDDRDGHDDRAHAADPHSAAVGLLRSAAEPAAARATHPDHHRLVRGPATAWKTDRGEGAAGRKRWQQGRKRWQQGRKRHGSREFGVVGACTHRFLSPIALRLPLQYPGGSVD